MAGQGIDMVNKKILNCIDTAKDFIIKLNPVAASFYLEDAKTIAHTIEDDKLALAIDYIIKTIDILDHEGVTDEIRRGVELKRLGRFRIFNEKDLETYIKTFIPDEIEIFSRKLMDLLEIIKKYVKKLQTC